jgi:hypothetical protein
MQQTKKEINQDQHEKKNKNPFLHLLKIKYSNLNFKVKHTELDDAKLN